MPRKDPLEKHRKQGFAYPMTHKYGTHTHEDYR